MSKLFILLGRTGDIINALPLFKAESEAIGQAVRVLTCKEYVPLFGGVSYVNPLPFDGTEMELRRAHTEAKAAGYEPVCIQVVGSTEDMRDLVYGPAGQEYALTDSFSKEPYLLTKQQALLAKQPRPVFDGRSKAREKQLIESIGVDIRNCILVAASGRSSPFPYTKVLFELLRSRFRDRYHIVDLSQYKTDRIYDFLGLYDLAHCLVSIDTAFLHLAHGSADLPVCALVNDKPGMWFGSAWRQNHISHIRYSDFPFRAVELLDAIEGIDLPGSYFEEELRTTKQRLIHVWSAYEVTEESEVRHKTAAATWEKQYESWAWIGCRVEVGAVGRDSRHHPRIEDDARFPFLKDVIRLACYRATEHDVIVLTRCDTALTDEISARLTGGSLPAYAHRRYQSEDGVTWHPAVDLFAFTKKWWQDNQKDVPDFVLSHDQYWSRTLLSIMQRTGGRELLAGVFRAPSTAKMPGGKRLAHNEKLHSEFQVSHGEITLAKAVVDQLPSVIINRHALEPYAYNPTIIQHNDRLLCCYRFHDQRDLSTALSVAQIDLSGNVLRKWPLQLPQAGGSEEDARFFMFKGELHLSYVDSTYPSLPARAVVKYGRLVEDGDVMKLVDIQQVQYGDNDYEHCNKNWIFFEHNNELLCWFTAEELIRVKGSTALQVAKNKLPGWEYGQIRGGTIPVPWKNGSLLRFFHSAIDSEIAPYRRRYFIGAMVMRGKHPFDSTIISKHPIITASERDILSAMERSGCGQYKPKVVFPLGCVPVEDGWVLSVGINDSHCALVKITETDLNL